MMREEKEPVKAEATSDPSKARLVVRSGAILMSEFCERLAYYSISSNLVLFFLSTLNMEKAPANILALVWSGTCYVTPLFGGWLADTYLGRWKTVVIFMSLYILSMWVLVVGSVPVVATGHSWVAFLGLFLIALGTGGIKANVVTFGADQFSDMQPDRAKVWKESFFNWFYFSINLGSLISFTAVAYVQQEISFTIGLVIPAIVMVLSTIAFASGTPWYLRLPPSGSVLGRSIMMIFTALKSKIKGETNMRGSFYDRALSARDPSGNALYTRLEVDNLKSLVKIVPVLFTFVVFWTIYAQMSSLFLTQGTVLDLKLGSFTLPASSLNLFNAVAIIGLIPLFDRIIYPQLRKCGVKFSMLKRIGAGLILAPIAMVYIGCLEIYRLYLFNHGYVITQHIGTKTVEAVRLTILTQIPGFFLIGASEVFASVTGLEFAYDQAPKTMRSMVQALYLLTTAAGSYLGSALLTLVNAITHPNWIGDDLNHSRLDLYFFLLAGLGLVNFIAFIFIARSYDMTKPRDEEDEEEESSLEKSPSVAHGGILIRSATPVTESTSLISGDEDE